MAAVLVDLEVWRDCRTSALSLVRMDRRADLTPLVAHTLVARLRRDQKGPVSAQRVATRRLANGEEVIEPQTAPRRLMRETEYWRLSPGEAATVAPLHVFRVACVRRLCLDSRATRICQILREELAACTRDLGRRAGKRAMQQAVAECA